MSVEISAPTLDMFGRLLVDVFGPLLVDVRHLAVLSTSTDDLVLLISNASVAGEIVSVDEISFDNLSLCRMSLPFGEISVNVSSFSLCELSFDETSRVAIPTDVLSITQLLLEQSTLIELSFVEMSSEKLDMPSTVEVF